MRAGMSAFRSTGSEIMLPYFMYLLAEAYGRLGLTKEGLMILSEAQAAIEGSGERWCEAEVQRLKGELILLDSDIVHSQEAESCFRRALAIARAQNAKSIELRAAISLSRYLRTQGQHASARDILIAVYNWFTEGFDTAHLRGARELLERFQIG
jgi:predicted ATPase